MTDPRPIPPPPSDFATLVANVGDGGAAIATAAAATIRRPPAAGSPDAREATARLLRVAVVLSVLAFLPAKPRRSRTRPAQDSVVTPIASPSGWGTAGAAGRLSG